MFRSELLLLLGPLALQSAIRYTSLYNVIKVGLVSGIISAGESMHIPGRLWDATRLTNVAITVLVDSYFWQQWPLWPELYGIYFNVIQGKSAEWGVSLSPPFPPEHSQRFQPPHANAARLQVEPFHAYVTSYLPKLLLSSLPLAGLGFALDGRVRSFLLPYLAFIGLISGLAHKEWRFVLYAVPAFNVGAARGATWL